MQYNITYLLPYFVSLAIVLRTVRCSCSNVYIISRKVDNVINVVLGSSISIGRHNLSPGYTALHSHASININ